jgi:hypothetical protein
MYPRLLLVYIAALISAVFAVPNLHSGSYGLQFRNSDGPSPFPSPLLLPLLFLTRF